MLKRPAIRPALTAVRALVTAGLIFGAVVGLAKAAKPEIWLTPREPFSLRDRNPSAVSDFLEMFPPNAPWTSAAAHVTVMQNATKFVLLSSDGMMSAVLRGLKARNIAYGLETGLLPVTAGCGKGVEGFARLGLAVQLARKVQRLGGTLAVLSMDEPLWFGHHYSGRGACHYSIAEVARQIAPEIRALKRVFPGIRVGDIEVVGATDAPDWVEEVTQWISAYRAAVGEPLAFFHADVNWNGPWRQQLRPLSARSRALGIPFGIIFIGNPGDATGEEAARHAEEKMSEVEADPELAPDHVIIQSWLREPSHNLPESRPGTMTYLVDRYLAGRSVLTVRRRGNQISGRLTDSAGNPLSGKPVQIVAADNGTLAITQVRSFNGNVPPNATSALLAFRVNTECGCSGIADVAFGTMIYRDERSGREVRRIFRPMPGHMAGHRFLAGAGEALAQNTARFPVTPGAPFSLEVPMQVSRSSHGSGYVAIIFFNRQGKGIKRDRLLLQTTTEPVARAVTDAYGRFSVPISPSWLASSRSLVAEFAGSVRQRLSSEAVP